MTRWLWTTVTAALALLTVVLAAMTYFQLDDARIAGSERSYAARRAAAAELLILIEEAGAELAQWEPGADRDPLFLSVRKFEGDRSPWMLSVEGADIRVKFERGGLVVDVGGTEGMIAAETVRARLVARENVGLPGERKDGLPTYTALGFISSAGETGLLIRADESAPDETEKTKDKARSILGEKAETLPLREIVAGRPADYNGAGEAPAYKGFTGQRSYGSWGRVPGIPELWSVAEIEEKVADSAAPGEPLVFEDTLVAVLHWWHLTIGLLVISLILTAWFWLNRRNERLGVILRCFSFARPYAFGIALVFLLGLLSTGIGMSKAIFAWGIFTFVLEAPPAEQIDRLWMLGGAVCVLGVVAGLITYFRKYLGAYYQVAIMADVRLTIGRKMAMMPLAFHDSFRAGDLIARIERDTAMLRKVYKLLFKNAAVEPFRLGWAAVAACMLNPRLALVLLLLPILMGPLFKIMKRIKKRAGKRQAQRADISHVLIQLLAGIRTVKAFAGEEREAQRLDGVNRSLVTTARKIARLTSFSEALLDLLQMLGAALVLVAGGYFILSGQVTTGELFGFLVVMQQFYGASKRVTATANQLVDATAGVDRVYEILDAESDLVSGPRTLAPEPLSEGIELEGVGFSYHNKQILHDVVLRIPAGQVVALVGPTGAGKSTVCSLVARFYDATSGRVTYDGVDVREYSLESLMESLSIVTQDAFLFNTTIEENIRYGKPGATLEEVQEAARAAFVHDEIAAMEGGYQKLAGERGGAVSGGQRQRITIARAILSNSPVLILDEATAALDSHAEKKVQAALDSLMGGRTVLVVAHRLSTIMHADKVVVLDDGRVVEEGPPNELLAREGGRFKRMHELQLGGGELGDDEQDAA